VILTEIYDRRRPRKIPKWPNLPLDRQPSLEKRLDNHESLNTRSPDDLPFSSR